MIRISGDIDQMIADDKIRLQRKARVVEPIMYPNTFANLLKSKEDSSSKNSQVSSTSFQQELEHAIQRLS